MTVVLVACVGKKCNTACEAQDLYVSEWFRKARTYAERHAWYILSAKHHLLPPREIIAPYELSLRDLTTRERRAWASAVVETVNANIVDKQLVVLAGERYRQYLIPQLEATGYTVRIPMQHMGIGQQLKWLKEQNEVYSAVSSGNSRS